VIYLASPYSADPEHNYQLALEAAARIVADGHILYSPIVHGHLLHLVADLPQDFAFWQRHNFGMLRKASELWVLDIPGWQTSTGVQAEIEFAKLAHIPRCVVDPTGLIRRELPTIWSVD
jgi:hypothetical protein